MYRAKHGVGALKLNDELNALAQVLFHNLHSSWIWLLRRDVFQEWADHLIAEGTFEHR